MSLGVEKDRLHSMAPPRFITVSTWAILSLWLIALPLALQLSCGADAPRRPDFDYKTFNARSAVAEWLWLYDRVAWLTTELAFQEPEETREKLGSEWFCLQHEGVWHAVYGRYDEQTDAYQAVLHYEAGEDEFVRSEGALPQWELDSFARALRASVAAFDPVLNQTDYRFNMYIRRIEDDRIEVWFLPAWQEDGLLVYGSEYRFLLDREGREILDSSILGLDLRGRRIASDDRWIIANDHADVPSVGQLFTLMLVRPSVDLVAIRSKAYTSMLLTVPERENDLWLHVSNDQDLDTAIDDFLDMIAEEDLKEDR